MAIIPFSTKEKTKRTITKKKVIVTKVKGFNKNGTLTNKRKARNLMSNAVIDSGIVGTILSLPHVECNIETQILNSCPDYNFIGVERDLGTFNAMAKFLALGNLTSKITPIYGLIGEQIRNAKENQFAHLILDYCGSITKIHEELSLVFSRNIVAVGGTIALTVNKRFIHTDFIYHMDKLCPYDKANSTMTHTEHIISKLILAKGGVGQYETIVSFEYSDKKEEQTRGANMLLLIVKRLN